jgi:hypothetical protein
MRRMTSRAIAVVLALTGCTSAAVSPPEPKRLATPDGLVELQFPSDWFRYEEQHPFDLQCFSKDERMMTAVFEFKREDLAATTTPREILDRQIEDMRSKRQKFVVVEREAAERNGERALTTIVHAGEKDGLRNHYRFTLVEFPANPAVFAVVLQTSFPSEWARTRPVLEAITRSARYRGAR